MVLYPLTPNYMTRQSTSENNVGFLFTCITYAFSFRLNQCPYMRDDSKPGGKWRILTLVQISFIQSPRPCKTDKRYIFIRISLIQTVVQIEFNESTLFHLFIVQRTFICWQSRWRLMECSAKGNLYILF
jgi:hypothetical protein